MLTEDQVAREVTKRKLVMQEKQSSRKRRYEPLTKIRAMRQVDFQKSEEEEQGYGGESSGEEVLMRHIVKHKKKIRRTAKESEVSSEESSSDEDKNPAQKKHKKKQCLITFKKIKITQINTA